MKYLAFASNDFRNRFYPVGKSSRMTALFYFSQVNYLIQNPELNKLYREIVIKQSEDKIYLS